MAETAKTIRLLLVEDNPLDALLLRAMLDSHGRYDVMEVATLAEAKEAAARQALDAVLLDLSLPDAMGIEAIDRLHEAAPEIPIIALTGVTDEETGLDAVSCGAQDYLVKGRADEALLVRTIRYAIDRKRAERALRRSSERFELLSIVAGRLLTSEDPQQLVEELCRGIMVHLDCQAFFNFIVDPASDRMRLNAYAGISAEEAKKIEWLDYGVAVCGCAARDGCRIVAEDILHTPDPQTELVKSYGIQAYACHPLMAGG